MQRYLTLGAFSGPSEELSVTRGISTNEVSSFLILGSEKILSGIHSAPLSLPPSRMGSAAFFPRSGG